MNKEKISKIKVCAISDLHGRVDMNFLKKNIDSHHCDILLIAGDIVPLEYQTFLPLSKIWFEKEFIPWCNSLNVDKIYIVAGNHDFYLERNEDEFRQMIKDSKIIYLNNEISRYSKNNDSFYIIGSPLCHKFGNWAFMKSDGEIKKTLSKIQDSLKEINAKCDILLIHDAPYKVNDTLNKEELKYMHRKDPGHIGNKPIQNFIEKIFPTYTIHGHLHSASHNWKYYGFNFNIKNNQKEKFVLKSIIGTRTDNTILYTKCVNVSLINESYVERFKPKYFTVTHYLK